MIPIEKWQWFGFAGHLILGEWCRFHLCTLVGRYLVSTVGKCVPPTYSGSEKTEYEWLAKNPHGYEIGLDRFYETMVFKAGNPCKTERCNCGTPIPSDYGELDFTGYKDAGSATTGHYAMCVKWAKEQEVTNENRE